jgi:hypothetical protein
MHSKKDVRKNAGAQHESDVAFYLNRAFMKNKDVKVFNNVVLTVDSETAQIDHLICYLQGFVIIESKSVKGHVQVNEHKEWSRSYNGQWFGIPSPIQQAELQIQILKHFLQANVDDLLGKVLGVRRGFGGRMYTTLVAISSSALINRDKIPKEINQLIAKAEFIPSEAQKLISDHSSLVRLVHWKKDVLSSFTKVEFDAITNLLEKHQRPVHQIKAQPAPTPEPHPQAPEPITKTESDAKPKKWLLACKKCGNSKGLQAMHGRYGYYVVCPSCQGNTPMKRRCSSCRSPQTHVSKSKNTFKMICAQCTTIEEITTDNAQIVIQ